MSSKLAGKGKGRAKAKKRGATAAGAKAKPARRAATPQAAPYAADPGAGYAYASTLRTLAKPKRKKPKRAVTGASSTAAGYRQNVSTAKDTANGTAQRVSALRALSPVICHDTKQFRGVLDILTNTAEPSAVRLAALQALQAASFSVVKFAPFRADYMAALRSVSADPDAELRQRVLGLLAREADGQTQQRLLEGLRDSSKALVPPEKALQLLSYDVHAGAYSAAREIVARPPSDAARREALRLLAADATSAPLFEKILKNKKETPEIRQLSASALHAIAPHALQTVARRIVMDKKEDDVLKAVSLTAVTDLRPVDEGTVDDKFYKQVGRMHGRSSSTLVKRSAKRFLKKYKR